MLSKIEKPVDRPPIITITGESGMGKTTLASAFPDPIVIRAEDGLQSIPLEKRPPAFPVLKSEEELWEQLTDLIEENHNYKTLIIDSVTALERFFIQSILEKDPKAKGINQALGGYGNGPLAVAAMHQRVRKAAGILNESLGMTIVFIAHADTEAIEPPDQDPYTRYSLRLNKKSVAPYVDDSDMVGFLRLVTFVIGDEGARKKAKSTGEIELIAHTTAANVSKNRYGIKQPIMIPEGVNPLLDLIPYFKQQNGEA